MNKQILKDFCQYQGKLTSIFFIPLIFLNILIPPIQLTTQTIEYNLCPIYLLPFFCSYQCNNIFVAKIIYLLLLINDRYNGRIFDRPRLFAFHWSTEKFIGASLQVYNAWTASDLLTCPFGSSTYRSKNVYNQLFVDYIYLILMPKVDICALDQECV